MINASVPPVVAADAGTEGAESGTIGIGTAVFLVQYDSQYLIRCSPEQTLRQWNAANTLRPLPDEAANLFDRFDIMSGALLSYYLLARRLTTSQTVLTWSFLTSSFRLRSVPPTRLLRRPTESTSRRHVM